MAKCKVRTCQKELGIEDFISEEEAMLCSPRAFIGEEFSNWCWGKNSKGNIIYGCYCLKHRKQRQVVKVFTDIETVKKWVKDYEE